MTNTTSYSYKPKMIIPVEVENKIRLCCIQSWDTEWSGVLFFTYKGSFKDKDLVIECKDIYVMDVGNQVYTEFDMNPDVISYMTENQELLDCQLGLIHSHNNMLTFFSGTDVNTLKEEGKDRNNFVSLIVNNEGVYTAAITRKTKIYNAKLEVEYPFFNQDPQKETIENTQESEQIEWLYFDIEKANTSLYNNDITARFKEIKRAKKEKEHNTSRVSFENKTYALNGEKALSKNKSINNSSIIKYINNRENISSINKGSKDALNYYYKNSDASYINDNYSSIETEPKKEETFSFYPDIDFDSIKVDTSIVHTIARQLITSSIILCNESKIDLNKWAKNMSNVYEKRFGKGEKGIKTFREWADLYVEFLTWNINDQHLKNLKYDQTDIQAIYSYKIVNYLSALPSNPYIEIYIEELSKYLID